MLNSFQSPRERLSVFQRDTGCVTLPEPGAFLDELVAYTEKESAAADKRAADAHTTVRIMQRLQELGQTVDRAEYARAYQHWGSMAHKSSCGQELLRRVRAWRSFAEQLASPQGAELPWPPGTEPRLTPESGPNNVPHYLMTSKELFLGHPLLEDFLLEPVPPREYVKPSILAYYFDLFRLFRTFAVHSGEARHRPNMARLLQWFYDNDRQLEDWARPLLRGFVAWLRGSPDYNKHYELIAVRTHSAHYSNVIIPRETLDSTHALLGKMHAIYVRWYRLAYRVPKLIAQ